MEAFGLFAAVIGMITGCVILCFVVVRSVEYAFAKKDDKRRHQYKIKEMSYACMRYDRLADNTVRQINDGLIQMYREMMELD